MARKVFLHIGAMKTGTTYLQQLMEANASALERAGHLFPVEGGWSNQVLAVRDVLGYTGDPRVKRRAEGLWHRMAGAMMSFDGEAAVLSMEFLSFAKRAGVQRIAASFEGAELHVILTVRDAAGVIPAQWQSSVRNGHLSSWPEFAEQLMAGPEAADSEGHKVFKRAQNVGRILNRWLQVVPPERFHVVTVPKGHAPRSLLWERFASVLGVDPAVCSEPAPRSNASLGHASTGLVRLLFLELGHLTVTERLTIKRQLASQILSERANLEPPARTNSELREFAARKNARMRSSIRAAGVHVVGALKDLPRVAAGGNDESDEIALPERADILEAAEYALPRARALVDKRAAALRDRDLPTTDLLERLPSPGKVEGADPLDSAVKELAAVIRVAIALRNRETDADLAPEDPQADA